MRRAVVESAASGIPSDLSLRLQECLLAFRRAAGARIHMMREFEKLVLAELRTAVPPTDQHNAGRDGPALSRWVSLAARSLPSWGFHEEAERLMRFGVFLVGEHEKALGQRLHKGTEFNDLAAVQIRLEKLEEAVHNLQVADQEDRATTGGGSALARANLLGFLPTIADPWFWEAGNLAER